MAADHDRGPACHSMAPSQDPSFNTLRHPRPSHLDALVALMQDNPEIRRDLLAADSRDQIQTILRQVGQPIEGDLSHLDPEQLRDAFRSD
jgi:hypothetical protein